MNQFKFSAAVVALVLAGTAHAGVTNGSFETGDFTGWITQDLDAPFLPMFVGTGGFTPGFDLFLSDPTDGSFAALHGFDGNGASGSTNMIRIAQDALIDGDTLTFDYRAGWNMTFGATINREFNVNIEVAGGGATLQTTLILDTAPVGGIMLDTGALSGSVDVSAFVGDTVRISFDFLVPEDNTGPAFFQLDNVALVPAPGVLAMLGVAALAGRRRRRS